MAATAVGTAQDGMAPRPLLVDDVASLEGSLQALLTSMARLARFRVDTQRLNVQGFVAETPASLTATLKEAQLSYEKTAQTLEMALLYAKAVVERDIRNATRQPHPAPPVPASPAEKQPPEKQLTPPATSSEGLLPFTTDIVDLVTPGSVASGDPMSGPESTPAVAGPSDEVAQPLAGHSPSAGDGGTEGALDEDLFGSNANSDIDGDRRKSGSPTDPATSLGNDVDRAIADNPGFDADLSLLESLAPIASGSGTTPVGSMPPGGASTAVDFSSLMASMPNTSAAPVPVTTFGSDSSAPAAPQDLLALFESLNNAPGAPSSGPPSVNTAGSSKGPTSESLDLGSLFPAASSSAISGAGAALDFAALASSGMGLPPNPVAAPAPPNAGVSLAPDGSMIPDFDFNNDAGYIDPSEFDSIFASFTGGS